LRKRYAKNNIIENKSKIIIVKNDKFDVKKRKMLYNITTFRNKTGKGSGCV